MTHFKKLTLGATVAGLLMAAGGANAHVSYNKAAGNTSGPADGTSSGPWTGGNGGYAGDLPANFIAFIHNDDGVANSQTASTAGARAAGLPANFVLGMGARGFYDQEDAPNWGHTSDMGLFQLHHDAWVTITVASDGSNLRPAFGLWSGWDTAGSGASRHGPYPQNGAIEPMAAGPLGTNLGLVDANAWAVADTQGTTSSVSLTRYLAAGNYTLLLGGYNGSVKNPNFAYTATISAAAVPVPASVWLFGSALAGLVGVKRRKNASV